MREAVHDEEDTKKHRERAAPRSFPALYSNLLIINISVPQLRRCAATYVGRRASLVLAAREKLASDSNKDARGQIALKTHRREWSARGARIRHIHQTRFDDFDRDVIAHRQLRRLILIGQVGR